MILPSQFGSGYLPDLLSVDLVGGLLEIDATAGSVTLRRETFRVSGATAVLDADGSPTKLGSFSAFERQPGEVPDPRSGDPVYYERDPNDSGHLLELRKVRELPH